MHGRHVSTMLGHGKNFTWKNQTSRFFNGPRGSARERGASEKAGRKEEIRKMERGRESSNKKILEEEARRKEMGDTGRRTY